MRARSYGNNRKVGWLRPYAARVPNPRIASRQNLAYHGHGHKVLWRNSQIANLQHTITQFSAPAAPMVFKPSRARALALSIFMAVMWGTGIACGEGFGGGVEYFSIFSLRGRHGKHRQLPYGSMFQSSGQILHRQSPRHTLSMPVPRTTVTPTDSTMERALDLV